MKEGVVPDGKRACGTDGDFHSLFESDIFAFYDARVAQRPPSAEAVLDVEMSRACLIPCSPYFNRIKINHVAMSVISFTQPLPWAFGKWWF